MGERKIASFPELIQTRFTPDEGDVGYIPSSSGLLGDCEGMNRMPPFSNEEFPNEESGEGKGSGNPY